MIKKFWCWFWGCKTFFFVTNYNSDTDHYHWVKYKADSCCRCGKKFN